MIALSIRSASDHLSFEQAIEQLTHASSVDGMAEFGSRSHHHFTPASDYDVLVVVSDLPAPVFQLVTTVQGRLTDIVVVETQTVDAFLASSEPPKSFFDVLFARKMQTAHILYDRSRRLEHVQQQIRASSWQAAQNNPPSWGTTYAAWFWQSFGLLHLERMAQSHDPLHQSAGDMMLASCVSATWRSYFELRALPWNGEKAALRYWKEYDTSYFDAVTTYLHAPNRSKRVQAYRTLVHRTLAPIGDILCLGQTAVVLQNHQSTPEEVQAVLHYWNALFSA